MKFFRLILLLLLPVSLYAEQYSWVFVPLSGPAARFRLQTLGLALEEGTITNNAGIEMLASPAELQKLRTAGFQPQIVQQDMESFLRNRQSPRSENSFAAGSMGGFLTYEEAMKKLQQFRNRFRNLVSQPLIIGNSIEGRPIVAIKISNHPDIVQSDEPEVLYTSLHHAREPESLMCVLYFMERILQGYGHDPEITYIVNHRQLWFVPVVNPDGYAYNQRTNPRGGGLWRKNRRNNNNGTFGVDLNRNYGWKWGFDNIGSSPFTSDENYRGPGPFSEPEIQAIRSFSTLHHFVTGLNYHSFNNQLIYPWNYTAGRTPNHFNFVQMAINLTRFNKFKRGNSIETVGYFANGEADDWMYGDVSGRSRTFAFTSEVGAFADFFWPIPARILPLAKQQFPANLALAWMAGGYPVVQRAKWNEIQGNGNGTAQPGETLSLVLDLRNLGVSQVLSGISVRLKRKTGKTTVVGANAAFGDLKPFATRTRKAFAVQIAPDADTGTATFELEIYSKNDFLRKEILSLSIAR